LDDGAMKLPFVLRSTMEREIFVLQKQLDHAEDKLTQYRKQNLAEIIEFIIRDTSMHDEFVAHKDEFVGTK
jgi:hypothetical protein